MYSYISTNYDLTPIIHLIGSQMWIDIANYLRSEIFSACPVAFRNHRARSIYRKTSMDNTWATRFAPNMTTPPANPSEIIIFIVDRSMPPSICNIAKAHSINPEIRNTVQYMRYVDGIVL